MTELLFMVEESPEGGYAARAVGESILTDRVRAPGAEDTLDGQDYLYPRMRSLTAK